MNKTFYSGLAWIITAMILTAGCSQHPHAVDNLAENDAALTVSNPDGENQTAELTAIQDPFVYSDRLTLVERLDSTAHIIEGAKALLDEEQFAPAGYWFALAKVMLADVKPDDLGEYRDYYLQLVLDINNFYSEYVSEVEVLPLETPPEAVLAGIEEAEGDTLNGEGEAISEEDSLALALGEFSRPEVELDSTESLAALDSLTAFPDVTLEYNDKVEKAIKFFQAKGRKVYTIWLQRAGTFIPRIKPILEAEGLPEDLVYLSMIESGFNTKAYSYAHAVGPWQFITSTARLFGLETGWWYDERRDPVKSTHAAARYLKKLYLEFGDWYLAFAAYNCGEGKVARHLQKYNASTFWELNKLPRQTRNYVPTYIAAAMIAKDPEVYGFNPIEFQEISSCDSVLITECVDFPTLAELAEVGADLIRELNPALVRGCTPPDREETWVYMPAGDYTGLTDKVKNLPPEKRRKFIVHTVRRGETLSTIAHKYRTSIEAICRVKENKIKNRNRIKPGQTITIPVLGSASQVCLEDEPAPPAPAVSDRERETYVVQKGDNLSTIADRFGTTVSALRSWNKLYRKRFIYPGQKLTVYVRPSGKSSSQAAAKNVEVKPAAPPDVRGHVVRKGETIWSIAQQYGLSVGSLLSANNLTQNSKIKEGDRLTIPEERAPSPLSDKLLAQAKEDQVHVVQTNDTLWSISQRYGVSIADLKSVNRLKSNKIKPGQKLVIPSID